tara:strand:- start:5266 stop:5793 length:528 start_codon:yes stop_codon:yes gene_type:complete
LSFKFYVLLLSLWSLFGCGFQPLYERHNNGGIADRFLEIEVAPVKNHLGQQFRNELTHQLHGGVTRNRITYRLVTELTESQASLAVQKSAFATRANLTVAANFTLIRDADQMAVFSSTGQSVVSFNILDSEFASSLAKRNARSRAVRELAVAMRLKLASYFESIRKNPGHTNEAK